mmetsp:Transcript_24912/g.51009  ORF Transcript_24912/g.51009 Transcript_24912/m.51009 type:complete len:259 (-) Transcript_24912:617-1393(-)
MSEGMMHMRGCSIILFILLGWIRSTVPLSVLPRFIIFFSISSFSISSPFGFIIICISGYSIIPSLLVDANLIPNDAVMIMSSIVMMNLPPHLLQTFPRLLLLSFLFRHSGATFAGTSTLVVGGCPSSSVLRRGCIGCIGVVTFFLVRTTNGIFNCLDTGVIQSLVAFTVIVDVTTRTISVICSSASGGIFITLRALFKNNDIRQLHSLVTGGPSGPNFDNIPRVGLICRFPIKVDPQTDAIGTSTVCPPSLAAGTIAN